MASAILEGNKIHLKCTYDDKDFVKGIVGRKWLAKIKKWELPLSVAAYNDVLKIEDVKIDPKLARAIAEIKKQLKAVNEFKITEEEIVPVENMPIKTTPYRHQILGFNIGMTLNNAGLFMEQGCGKTLSSIAITGCRYNRGEIKRVLIIAPASVLPVWLAELEKHADFKYDAVCLEKSISKRQEYLENWKLGHRLQIAIINYEAVWRMIPSKKNGNRQTWELNKSVFGTCWKPDMIICDECHPENVLIDTPSGPKAVQTIKEGDIVYGYDHSTEEIIETKVNHTFNRETSENIIMINGLKMTPHHPVYTLERGYVPAKDLTEFDTLLYTGLKEQEIRNVKKTNPSINLQPLRERIFRRQSKPTILQSFMCSNRQICEESKVERDFSYKHAKNIKPARSTSENTEETSLRCQSIQKSDKQKESSNSITRTWLHPLKWGERNSFTDTTKVVVRKTRMADRICGVYKTTKNWVSNMLQNRYCGSNLKNCNRSGRMEPYDQSREKQGQKENRILDQPRMESSEVLEQRSPGKLESCNIESNEGCTVYNIETKTHNYFANGILVHNSQRIKNHTASQSKGIHKLAEIAKYRMILTGTPITQSPLDIFSQFKFLDGSIFGSSYYAFKCKYAVMDFFGNPVRYLEVDDLKKKTHSITYRITKADALDLPGTVDQELFCELEPAAMKQYKMMKKESLMELRAGELVTAANILTKLLRLSQITGGYMKNSDERLTCISNAKMKLLKETIEDLVGAGKKAVIFARFIPEITSIRKLCDKLKLKYAWIAGEVKDRGTQVDTFQTDSSCKIFIAQIQTAGLGITLTAADTEIFYSSSYSYGDYDQARARIHRIGQVNKCTYLHLLAKSTVDEKILKILKNKKSVADGIIDNWRTYFED